MRDGKERRLGTTASKSKEDNVEGKSGKKERRREKR